MRQPSWTHSSVAQSIQFQDLKVSASKCDPITNPATITNNGRLRKPASGRLKVATGTQSQTNVIMASTAPPSFIIKNSAWQSNTNVREYTADYSQFATGNRDMPVQDYLLVPTATMATSADEIRRFSEIGAGSAMMVSNIHKGGQNVSSSVDLPPEQDPDYYKKVLGINQQGTTQLLDKNAPQQRFKHTYNVQNVDGGVKNQKSLTIAMKQHRAQRAQSSLRPQVREVTINKQDMMPVQRQKSAHWPAHGALDAKTPDVRTALLKGDISETALRANSGGSLAEQPGAEKSLPKTGAGSMRSETTSQYRKVTNASGNLQQPINQKQEGSLEENPYQQLAPKQIDSSELIEIDLLPLQSAPSETVSNGASQKHAVLVKQKTKNQSASQQTIQLSQPQNDNNGNDWLSQQSMHLKEKGSEDGLPESRPAERYANKLAEKDEESLSQLRREEDDNSDPIQKEGNSNDPDEKDSAAGFVQVAESYSVHKQEQHESEAEIVMESAVRPQEPQGQIFEAIKEVAPLRQSHKSSIREMSDAPTHKLHQHMSETDSEISRTECYQSNDQNENDYDPQNTGQKLMKKVHEQLERDIQKNAQIRASTPVRHAPQNVHRSNNDSPLLKQHRSTVAEMRNSYAMNVISSGDGSASGPADMSQYGISAEFRSGSGGNAVTVLGTGGIQAASNDHQQKLFPRSPTSDSQVPPQSLDDIQEEGRPTSQDIADLSALEKAQKRPPFKTLTSDSRVDQGPQNLPINGRSYSKTGVSAADLQQQRITHGVTIGSETSFSNQHIRNKFIANKGVPQLSYPKGAERISKMMEIYSSANLKPRTQARPNSVGKGSTMSKTGCDEKTTLPPTLEQQINESLKEENVFNAYFRENGRQAILATGLLSQGSDSRQDVNNSRHRRKRPVTAAFSREDGIAFTNSENPFEMVDKSENASKATAYPAEDPFQHEFDQMGVDEQNWHRIFFGKQDNNKMNNSAWAPSREAVYPEAPDLMERKVKFEQYMAAKKLNNEGHMENLEALVARRAGLQKKPLGFSLQKELYEIGVAKHEQSLAKLDMGDAAQCFTQFTYYHHSDEYQMRAKDLKELANDHDSSTAAGRARIREYEELKKKIFKPFDARLNEIILSCHDNGHLYQPIRDFKLAKQGKAPGNDVITVVHQDNESLPEGFEEWETIESGRNGQPHADCSLEKIMKGDYLGRLAKRTIELGSFVEGAEFEEQAATRQPEKLAKDSFDCVTKAANRRQPLEQNLVLSILFKAFKMIDHRIAKNFNVLAGLVPKLKAVEYAQGKTLAVPYAPIETIFIVYSGQVEQTYHEEQSRESKLLMSGDIIGEWYLKERRYPQSCQIGAQVVSEKAQVFSLRLQDVDSVLDKSDQNQLSTFVAIVRFYMARDPISLASFGTQDGQLRLDFAAATAVGAMADGSADTSALRLGLRRPMNSSGPSPNLVKADKAAAPTGTGARRQNKLRQVNQIYEQNFRVTPFFTRDFFSLIERLELKTYGPGAKIYGFKSVPTKFYVVKQGRVRLEDERLQSDGQQTGNDRQKEPVASGLDTQIIKVEGEWFGFESFICGPYSQEVTAPAMTQEQLLQDRRHSVGNGFRATAIERCEVVVGSLETMFDYLSMADVARLHRCFVEGLYAKHPAYNALMGLPL